MTWRTTIGLTPTQTDLAEDLMKVAAEAFVDLISTGGRIIQLLRLNSQL